ncbi:hypothetical protein [Caldibacillus debilis]|uniref:hypothetical protein n=1 Tax=Caldibacillus debilis TaxID=301148 RepID=UPI000B56C0B7|nr:hypothetical protein [Caldibacillus debilis]OUM89268.1 MAG: hypothetical protein BAA03_12135 [Caldibacillus debilis]
MSFLLIGLLIIALILLNKNDLIGKVGAENFLARKLKNAEWFQNSWLSGIFLFFINALLFGLTIFVLTLFAFVAMHFPIPFLHIVIMFVAALSSIYVWMAIHHAENPGRKERFITGTVGSSFYFLLMLVFIFRMAALEPNTPERDTAMEFFGLAFAAIVAFTAFITCLAITAFPAKRSRRE